MPLGVPMVLMEYLDLDETNLICKEVQFPVIFPEPVAQTVVVEQGVLQEGDEILLGVRATAISKAEYQIHGAVGILVDVLCLVAEGHFLGNGLLCFPEQFFFRDLRILKQFAWCGQFHFHNLNVHMIFLHSL